MYHNRSKTLYIFQHVETKAVRINFIKIQNPYSWNLNLKSKNNMDEEDCSKNKFIFSPIEKSIFSHDNDDDMNSIDEEEGNQSQLPPQKHA